MTESPPDDARDQRLILYHQPWSHFEVQLALRGDAPVPRMAVARDRSRLFPDLDLELLVSFLDRPTPLQAVRAFREALRTP